MTKRSWFIPETKISAKCLYNSKGTSLRGSMKCRNYMSEYWSQKTFYRHDLCVQCTSGSWRKPTDVCRLTQLRSHFELNLTHVTTVRPRFNDPPYRRSVLTASKQRWPTVICWLGALPIMYFICEHWFSRQTGYVLRKPYACGCVLWCLGLK
jgi:hypothetical protein